MGRTHHASDAADVTGDDGVGGGVVGNGGHPWHDGLLAARSVRTVRRLKKAKTMDRSEWGFGFYTFVLFLARSDFCKFEY